MTPDLLHSHEVHNQTMAKWWAKAEYIRERKAFVKRNPSCARCGRPATTPATEIHDKLKEIVAKHNGDFRIGTSVKQIGGPRLCVGIGKIKRIPQGQGEVLVAFDNGMEWLKREYLQIVAEGTA